MRTMSAVIQAVFLKARESSVDNHEIALGDDRSVLILQLGRKTHDQIAQAIAAGSDMSAVLDVVSVTSTDRRRSGHAC
jgi:hypothetical protein